MEKYHITAGRITENQVKNCFYILCKGLNSGKPLKKPCPNCFTVITKNETDLEILYWLSFALWKGRKFEIYLTGSVIPFLRITDFRNIISNNLKQVIVNPLELQKTVRYLQFIEEKEQQLIKNLKLVKQLKVTYVHSYFNNKK
jgi:hypothetical protein